jgi:hypothetical protein
MVKVVAGTEVAIRKRVDGGVIKPTSTGKIYKKPSELRFGGFFG